MDVTTIGVPQLDYNQEITPDLVAAIAAESRARYGAIFSSRITEGTVTTVRATQTRQIAFVNLQMARRFAPTEVGACETEYQNAANEEIVAKRALHALKQEALRVRALSPAVATAPVTVVAAPVAGTHCGCIIS